MPERWNRWLAGPAFPASLIQQKMVPCRMVPCVIFEDDHLLAVNKPAGWNTHSPALHAGEGIFDWLRNREPRWASLAILHRLDKDTSGVLIFGKTPLANRSLTQQFTERMIVKTYLLATDRPAPAKELSVKTALVRLGEKYGSRPGGEPAETRFEPAAAAENMIEHRRLHWLVAKPLTGRTHQIRVHAAENGFPVLGDALYGGTVAHRLFLHAAEIQFRHPATNASMTLRAPPKFGADPALELRAAFIDPAETDAYRLIHGASDARPGWYVEKLGEWLLSQSDSPLAAPPLAKLEQLGKTLGCRGAYHKILSRRVRQASLLDASPQHLFGEAAPDPIEIMENGVRYALSFREGYSVGLFLDQRDNRRRLLNRYLGPEFEIPSQAPGTDVLNVFSYTCGFSVCAARAGARTTSLDLSKKYLDWGRTNFRRNGLGPERHDFIFGDAFDWLRRLARKGRRFEAIILDPPTFSKSRDHGAFRAEKDFGELVGHALKVLKPSGLLLAASNAADWSPEKFTGVLESAVEGAGRRLVNLRYLPQPPDFPVSRSEPAYLKTAWVLVQ